MSSSVDAGAVRPADDLLGAVTDMSHQVYESVLQTLAERLAVSPADLLSTGVLEIDEVSVQLQYRNAESEPFLLMLVHFGEITSRDRQGPMRRLLEVNLYLADSELCTYFAADPTSGEVVLCVRALVLDVSVDYLYSTIMAAVAQAGAWRRGEYDTAS